MNKRDRSDTTPIEPTLGEDATEAPEMPPTEASTRSYYGAVSRRAPGLKYVLYLLSSGLLIFPFQFLTSLALGSDVGNARSVAMQSALFFPILSLPFVAFSARREGIRRLLIFPGYFTALLFALDAIVPGYGLWHRLWRFSYTQYYRGIPFVVDGSPTIHGAALGVFQFLVQLSVLLAMSRIFVFSLGATPESDGYSQHGPD